tara:strand:+ start:733 stop:2397 length:1665 start_codon:yes stop_codon:yes gene_type:complete
MQDTTKSEDFKVLKSLRVTIEDLLLDTIEYLTNKFNQSKNVFTAASPFGQILIVIENLTQLVFYYIEDSITELNMNEATRLTSIYSLASLAGHNPSRAVSATGEISLIINDDAEEIPTDLVIIPNLTRLTNINTGLQYILDLPQDEVKFSLNGDDDGVKLNIRQGTIETQTVTARGVELESFSIGSSQNFFIDNFYINVFVNGEKWKRYESLLDIPRNGRGYIAKTGVTSGLDIFFGNTSFGKIPNPGSDVIVEYLVTEGPGGNIRTTDTSQVKFNFIDTGFSLLGEEIELNDYINIATTQAPFFGSNPESSEMTRLIAPNTSKSFALVNPDHYEIVLRKLNLFSLISVYLDELDDRVLNLFLIPNIKKTFSFSQDYYGADLDRFRLSEHQKIEISKYLEKTGSKLISTDIKIIDPVIIKYVINTTIIAFDDVSTDIIKNEIYTSIATYFINNSRRKRIPKSDLIKILEEINGIDSVAITILGDRNETAKALNPNAILNGLDEFNDIIITKNQLPLIRGGFSDRYGNQYAKGISEDSLGAVNIKIQDIVPRPKL